MPTWPFVGNRDPTEGTLRAFMISARRASGRRFNFELHRYRDNLNLQFDRLVNPKLLNPKPNTNSSPLLRKLLSAPTDPPSRALSLPPRDVCQCRSIGGLLRKQVSGVKGFWAKGIEVVLGVGFEV